MKKIIEDFLRNDEIKNKFINQAFLSDNGQIYNEASFQYELAKFLELKGYSVRLEFNVKRYMQCKNKHFVKRDIDIVAIQNEKKYAIELKFPKNGQYPEQMYQFIKDIAFMQEVKKFCAFDATYCLTIVCDNIFYDVLHNNVTENKIYNYFRRCNKEIKIESGKIYKPTGPNANKSFVQISSCETQWIDLKDKISEEDREYKYYLIENK